jgi:hypothetical protein
MSAPDIPTNYTVTSTTNLGGSIDMGLDEIRIKEIEIGPLGLTTTSTVNSNSSLTSESKLTSNSNVDLGLDNIQIKELPKIELQVSVKPTRIHLPINICFGVRSLGIELLTFNICGEGMVIVEDYIPHKTEICR